jgi:hypothetical protein
LERDQKDANWNLPADENIIWRLKNEPTMSFEWFCHFKE